MRITYERIVLALGIIAITGYGLFWQLLRMLAKDDAWAQKEAPCLIPIRQGASGLG